MNIIHGTWIPQSTPSFNNRGAFCVWVEQETHSSTDDSNVHPFCLREKTLLNFFKERLGLTNGVESCFQKGKFIRYFCLPSLEGQPLPSLEMLHYQGHLALPHFQWGHWETWCCLPQAPLAFLKEIHFLSLQEASEIRLGGDLLFWYHYSMAFKEILLKDQYIPALIPHQLDSESQTFEYIPSWQIVSKTYQKLLKKYQGIMPLACRSGQEQINLQAPFYSAEPLLAQFSEQVMYDLIQTTPFTKKLLKSVENTLVETSLPSKPLTPLPPQQGSDWDVTYQQWKKWRKQLLPVQGDATFTLCFRLKAAGPENPERWVLEFLAESQKDPSLKVSVVDYWYLKDVPKEEFHKYFGDQFERNFLTQMGIAARIYPKLWPGLETGRPYEMALTMAEAHQFLQESAWVLEEAGFRIIVPSWWTPEGRKRAKLRLKASAPAAPKDDKGRGYFSFYHIAKYEYQLSIGGIPVSKEEWVTLINAKTPLVRFRGEWMELDQQRMQEMLEFWEAQQEESSPIGMAEMVQKTTEENEDIEFDFDENLSSLMVTLQEKSRLIPQETPTLLDGELRPYQKRGLAWLLYLESLGMNACLADDMGLGKTIQIIALLLVERELREKSNPTLLIAPTSVLGNWAKEIERFGPSLQIKIHHGGQRPSELDSFKARYRDTDIVITSFALVRIDAELFQPCYWRRVVVDEAQNIKTPNSEQTRSILKLKSRFRIALTGTPIENRLLDLWSIFNFLNPGFLGTQSQFRETFELPIQKENDRQKRRVLQRLVNPFILRRLKTDKSIIKDLPDKVEQKVHCHLSKEQASLYQAVVDEVENALDSAEDSQRQGLMLSTLMKLKQICNHPAHFLKDGSDFSKTRSQKLERLLDMTEEILENQESLLIFTQFQEIGLALENLFKNQLHYRTWYLHGGVSRKHRETMIQEFQDPETEAGVFILSLKAGGVGITLTKANHVFHFDRWWNPAVENQATDRAFRIGQTKKVFVHKFVSVGTLEEQIDKMLANKKWLSDSVVRSGESWMTNLDNETFKRLIALNRNTIME